MKEILIALAIVVGVFLLVVIFGRKWKLFKKKDKSKSKNSTKKVEAKQEEKKEDKKPQIDKNISFEKREVKETDSFAESAVIEDFEVNDKEYKEYTSASQMFRGRRPNFNSFPTNFPKRFNRQIQKKSIKQQIEELSPEMKAVVFARVLDKMDDKF